MELQIPHHPNTQIPQKDYLPEDIKILFCDNRSDCSRLSPPIPSIHYPRKQMGQDAVEALLAEEFIPGENFYRGELILR